MGLSYLELIFVIALSCGLCGGNVIQPLFSPEQDAELQKGRAVKYYISTAKATYMEAQDLCARAGYKLASVENAYDNKGIVARLQQANVEKAWTSGREVVDGYSSAYVWDTDGSPPVVYENFDKKLERTIKPYANYSEFYGHGPPPGDGGGCSDNPGNRDCCQTKNQTCAQMNEPKCEITKPGECRIESPSCSVVVEGPPCSVQPVKCQVEPPTCSIRPGECKQSNYNCSVSIPGKCEATPSPCTAIQPPCQIIPGSCIIVVDPGCETNCTTTPRPCTPSTSKPCDTKLGHLKDCTPGPITCPPPITVCTPSPCGRKKKVCGRPTINCPSPIVHCPEPCASCPGPDIKCDKPEVICSEPTLECTEPKVVCEQPKPVCPEPIVKCNEPCIVCDPPTVKCEEPIIECDCPQIECPPCEQPCLPPPPPPPTMPPCHPCTTTTRKPCIEDPCEPQPPCCEDGHDGHHRRGKRSTGPVNQCIAILKDANYKWVLEDCDKSSHYVCESQ